MVAAGCSILISRFMGECCGAARAGELLWAILEEGAVRAHRSGTASQLSGANFELKDALTFDEGKPVGRICLDGLASTGAQVTIGVCLDGSSDPVAQFALRNQSAEGNWQAEGDLTHDALDKVPAGEHNVSLKVSADGVAADREMSILLRSLEFVQSSFPTLYLDLDSTQDDTSEENKAKGYGTLAQVLASRDHDVRCSGLASLIVPEGFVDEYGAGQESFKDVELDYVRGRGNSTWDEKRPKKPFKFKFDKKRELFSMGKNKHWALLANSFDGSLVRDRLTSWIGNKIGLEYTYKCVPVDLVVNEAFYGSYLL